MRALRRAPDSHSIPRRRRFVPKVSPGFPPAVGFSAVDETERAPRGTELPRGEETKRRTCRPKRAFPSFLGGAWLVAALRRRAKCPSLAPPRHPSHRRRFCRRMVRTACIEASQGSRSCSAPRRNATVTRTRVPSTVATASSHRARSLPSSHAAPPNICDSAFGSGRCDERAGDLSFGVLRMGEHLCSRRRCLVWTTKLSVPSRAPSR